MRSWRFERQRRTSALIRNTVEGTLFIAAWIAAMAAVIRLMEIAVMGFEGMVR